MSGACVSFGFWNLRGLNDSLKQKTAKNFLHDNKLSMCGLLEHKIKEPNLRKVMNFVSPHWSFAHNCNHSPFGRIVVCWDPLILSVQILGMSKQFIHCEVKVLHEDLGFYATFVYGSNDQQERQELWTDLLCLNNLAPWVVLWEFNVIRSSKEKSGGTSLCPSYVDEFNSCLYHSGLEDLRFSGCHLIWSNRQQPPNHVSSKIDRALVNEDWLKTYPYSSSFFPTPWISDHSLAVVYIILKPKLAIKPFRFFVFLQIIQCFFLLFKKLGETLF